MSVENPMVLGDDGVPFDDFYVTCRNCGEEYSPMEMDEDLEDVCVECVANCIAEAKRILKEHMYASYYEMFAQIIEAYTDGAL